MYRSERRQIVPVEQAGHLQPVLVSAPSGYCPWCKAWYDGDDLRAALADDGRLVARCCWCFNDIDDQAGARVLRRTIGLPE